MDRAGASAPASLTTNLLRPDLFYAHSALLDLGPHNKVNLETDEGTMDFVFHETKQVKRFTMQNLLDYYYEQCQIPREFREGTRDAGAFRYLMETQGHRLDTVLHAIDLVAGDGKKITSPFGLRDSLYEGKDQVWTALIGLAADPTVGKQVRKMIEEGNGP